MALKHELNFIKTRTLVVVFASQELQVEHVHFTGWPDWETPDQKSTEALYKMTKDSCQFLKKQQEAEESEKLLVHCKAGVGRTGTTIALINALLMLDNGSTCKELSVFSIVRKLRE